MSDQFDLASVKWRLVMVTIAMKIQTNVNSRLYNLEAGKTIPSVGVLFLKKNIILENVSYLLLDWFILQTEAPECVGL